MDQRSPSHEATLLFQTSSLPEPGPVAEETATILDLHGQTPRRVDRVGRFTLFTCDGVEVLLAFNLQTLPVEHFIGAQRPAAASLPESEILARLTDTAVSVTVLVVDSEAGSPSERCSDAQKREICREIAEGMVDSDETLACTPGLVPNPPACGFGPELIVLMPGLLWWHRRKLRKE